MQKNRQRGQKDARQGAAAIDEHVGKLGRPAGNKGLVQLVRSGVKGAEQHRQQQPYALPGGMGADRREAEDSQHGVHPGVGAFAHKEL